MAIADDGTIFAVGHTYQGSADAARARALIVAYDAYGNLLWEHIDDSELPNEFHHAIAISNATNRLWVGGRKQPTDNDNLTLGYLRGYSTSDGALQLDHEIAPNITRVSGVALDAQSGAIYLSGVRDENFNLGGRENAWTARVDVNGNILWEQAPTMLGDDYLSEDDVANDLTLDALGNLYVTGAVVLESSGYDLWVASYGPDGSERWTYTQSGYSDRADTGRAITVGADAKIYVAGDLVSTSAASAMPNAFLLALDPDTGDRAWDFEIDVDEWRDSAYGVVASDDRITLTGGVTAQVNDDCCDIFRADFDFKGGLIGSSLFNYPISSSTVGRAVSSDAWMGRVFVGSVYDRQSDSVEAWVVRRP